MARGSKGISSLVLLLDDRSGGAYSSMIGPPGGASGVDSYVRGMFVKGTLINQLFHVTGCDHDV